MFQEWTIPTDLHAGRKLAEDILKHVRVQGYDQDICFAIRLALEEALINAIKHGNRCDPRKKISISAYVGMDKTDITIADEGGGFNPQALPDPTADENLEKPGGRGIMLMRAYMDQVSFNPQGNQVRMIKNRPREGMTG
jgi:serine/threonine-protein kinase RsbW